MVYWRAGYVETCTSGSGADLGKPANRKVVRRHISSSHNEEQDVKTSIMMIVGACIFLVAAAQALPLFFGVSS